MYTIKFKNGSVKEFKMLRGVDLRHADLRGADLLYAARKNLKLGLRIFAAGLHSILSVALTGRRVET